MQPVHRDPSRDGSRKVHGTARWHLAVRRIIAAAMVCSCPVWGYAQTPDEADEAELRAELRRVLSQDPSQHEAARKALDELDQQPSTATGRQARNRRERGARRIVNGLPSRGLPSVGAVLRGSEPETARAHCTGTLVGCDKVLTAAHCVTDNPDPRGYVVFFQDLGFFRVRDIRWPEKEFKDPSPYFDIAMITLERPVEGIAPMPLNGSAKVLNNQIATIVGFGRTGGSRQDFGIKREGTVRFAGCPAERATDKVLCWTFDADVRSMSGRSNTCNGDSGGPVIMIDRDGTRLVRKVFGVVSGGRDDNCVKDDSSHNVDVREFSRWIVDAGEGRLTSQQCVGLLPIDASHGVHWLLATLDSAKPEAVMSFDVVAGTALLRVTLNGEDSGHNDFDLELRRGAEQTTAGTVCRRNASGQFATCEVAKPAPGAWAAMARRKAGAGQVQMTASQWK